MRIQVMSVNCCPIGYVNKDGVMTEDSDWGKAPLSPREIGEVMTRFLEEADHDIGASHRLVIG